MSRVLRVTVIGLAATFGGLVLWRYLARRRSLPCPTALAWFLEMQGTLVDRLFRTEETLDAIGLRPGQRVLEVGPGPGRLLIRAAQRVAHGGEVVGLDIQPGMLERLRARAAEAGVTNLTTMLGDATQTHFAPETFDVVYLVTVLGEITDRAAALRQCYAALKPGGVLSITEVLPDPHYQSVETVRQLAESVGFTLREVRGPRRFFTANFAKDGTPS